MGYGWALEARLCLDAVMDEERSSGVSWTSTEVNRARAIVAFGRRCTEDIAGARNALEEALKQYREALAVPPVQTRVTGHLRALVRVLTDILMGGIDTLLESYFGSHTANTTKAADAFIGLGRIDFDDYKAESYNNAMGYVVAAQELVGYALPAHLQEYASLFVIMCTTSHANSSSSFYNEYCRLMAL